MSAPRRLEAIEEVTDDAFVRTAIRGLRIPEHHPDFWDHLAQELDDVEDDREPRVDLADARPTPARARRTGPAHLAGPADHPPRRAPLRAVDPLPAEDDELVDAEVAYDQDDPAAYEPVRAPRHAPRLHAAPRTADDDAPAAAPSPSGWADPRRVQVGSPSGAVPAAVASAARPSAESRLFQAATGGASRGLRPVADPLERFTVRHDDATMPFSMRRASNAVLVAVGVAAAAVAMVAGLSLVRQRSEAGAPPPVAQVEGVPAAAADA